ncbi:hypothetical protein ACH5RR_010447 [Cinchona calisaya]|uniref:Pentatricopeptide repeat-containing protein n=1 Tax=Cinchona calisaya TaxID=153742 RepID=A0ABD3AIZ1_9GENT
MWSNGQGIAILKIMKKNGLIPWEDYQTWWIDMLGHFGRLDEAFYLLEETEDTESLGESSRGTAQISIVHISLSNVYAAALMWHEAYGVGVNWRKEGDVKESRVLVPLPCTLRTLDLDSCSPYGLCNFHVTFKFVHAKSQQPELNISCP